MPFSGANDPNLPSNVKTLSPSKRSQWVNVWNAAFNRCESQGRSGCEASAFRIANGSLATRESTVPVVNMGGGISLLESFSSSGTGVARVLREGPNLSKTFLYPGDVLKRDCGVFNGAQVFIDHPTKAEQRERPERSFNAKVGVLGDATWNESARSIEAPLQIYDPVIRDKLSRMKEANTLSEAQLSINAIGRVKDGKLDGGEKIEIVQALTQAVSVDIVTSANAGGEILLFESRRSKETSRTMDITQEEKDQIIAEAQAESSKENARLKEEAEAATARAEDAERKNKLSETRVAVQTKLEDSELPDPAKKAIEARFSESDTTEGLDEAVKDMEILVEAITTQVTDELKKKTGTHVREAQPKKRGVETPSKGGEETSLKETIRTRTKDKFLREYDGDEEKAERATKMQLAGV